MSDEERTPDLPPVQTDTTIPPSDGARPTGRAYRLLEFRSQGDPVSETFAAPDDEEARQRVIAVLPDTPFELWCGRRLVSRRMRC